MRRLLWGSVLCVIGCAGGATPTPKAPEHTASGAAAPPLAFAARSTTDEADPLLDTMRTELDRALAALARAPQGAPYFLAYQISRRQTLRIDAVLGALNASHAEVERSLDLDLRLGSHELDSSHVIRGREGRSGRSGAQFGNAVPLDGVGDGVRVALWTATDREYARASARIAQIKAEQVVRVAEEDRSGDFSREAPLTHLEPVATLALDRSTWEARMRAVSAVFRDYPSLHRGHASLDAEVLTRHFVSSEGSRVRVSQPQFRVRVSAETRADDGMELALHEIFAATSEAGLPSTEALAAAAKELAETLIALRKAPIAEPYVGPAILEGDAASVFFHEVFGHRAEGHRLKDESEGQTFAKMVGTAIMPEFINVYDDPNASALGTTTLLGHYAVDDQAVRAQRVDLVENGVLKAFLMSRTPALGIDHSNGHGRRQEGHDVVARQANLIIHPTRTVAPEALRARLLEEVRAQGKPYGLIFKQVTGGFTMTQRYGPQAFKVQPVLVTRLFGDGREELIRGVDMEGTPLTALSTILAAGDDYTVFNGTCGAESGWVPVSALSPSVLLGQVEVARQEKSQDRPPLLPTPSLQREPTP